MPLGPVWRARASQAFARKPNGARARTPRVTRQHKDVLSSDRTAKARSAGSGRAIRVAFLLVPFLWRRKEKEPAAGQPPAIVAVNCRWKRHKTIWGGAPRGFFYKTTMAP